MNNRTTASELLDEELVARVQRGDKKAYDLLVTKYQNKVVQVVNRYLKDPSEAQDVAQEAFIKAYRALSCFRGEASFYTLLYRIAINTAKNYVASRNRRGSQFDVDIYDAEIVENAEQLRGLETPENLLMNDEILMAIRSAIDSLPDEMRTAILLREFDGLSYEAIAQAMDFPV